MCRDFKVFLWNKNQLKQLMDSTIQTVWFRNSQWAADMMKMKVEKFHINRDAETNDQQITFLFLWFTDQGVRVVSLDKQSETETVWH